MLRCRSRGIADAKEADGCAQIGIDSPAIKAGHDPSVLKAKNIGLMRDGTWPAFDR